MEKLYLTYILKVLSCGESLSQQKVGGNQATPGEAGRVPETRERRSSATFAKEMWRRKTIGKVGKSLIRTNSFTY